MEDEAPELPDLECPTCGEIQQHEVVRAAESGWTVRCLECKTARTLPAPRKVRLVTVPLILSEGAASSRRTLPVASDEPVGVDDEFDLDGHRIRVTAIELPDGTRPARAKGSALKTLYGVVFDTVTLHYTVNQGEVTRSFQEAVLPEEEVHVGSVREVQGVRLAVKTLKSDQNRTIHRGFLLARSVSRVFADLASGRARPGDRVRTRSRGDPAKQARTRRP